MNAAAIYAGTGSRGGSATRAFLKVLERRGPLGIVAMNLFRAQKCSSRAKLYRGGIRGVGSYRSLSYSRKGWSIEELCRILQKYPELGIRFGWKKDPKLPDSEPNWVLYIDLPDGQVSFHSLKRYAGPDYAGDYDGQRKSEERILHFCDQVYKGAITAPQSDSVQSNLFI